MPSLIDWERGLMPKPIDAAEVRNLLVDMEPDTIRTLHGDALTQSGHEFLTEFERMGDDLDALNELIQEPNPDLVALQPPNGAVPLGLPWMGRFSALVLVAAVVAAAIFLTWQPEEKQPENRMLITRNVQTNSQDIPLFDAIRAGELELVERALEQGADLNQMEETTGWLPLTAAVLSGHQNTLKALLAAGADINRTDRNGLTTLMHAAQLGYPSALSLLIDSGANLKTRDGQGRTPLMRAASEGHYDAVKLLLEHGANPGTEDNQGMSAVDWARFGGHQLVLDLLTAATPTQ